MWDFRGIISVTKVFFLLLVFLADADFLKDLVGLTLLCSDMFSLNTHTHHYAAEVRSGSPSVNCDSARECIFTRATSVQWFTEVEPSEERNRSSATQETPNSDLMFPGIATPLCGAQRLFNV